jgi:cellulase/cellobiase CelA1
MTSKEAREFLRSHVLGLVAIFIALTGTAVASQQSGTSGGPKASASVVTDAKFKKLKKRVAALEKAAPASGPAGGVLTGAYPNPQLAANSVRASQLGPIVQRLGQFSGAISANTGFSVSADCDPGEVAISGGVDVGNSFTTHTVESRRLDTDTWTVTLQTGTNPDTATAEVYCLQV